MKTRFRWTCGLAVAVLAACQGGSGNGGAVVESAITPCMTDADCGEGRACTPVACADACVPDASGQCLPCGGYRGVCGDGGKVPATPAPSCAASLLGDPAGCRDPGTWKQIASDLCLAMGSGLSQLGYGQACDGGFRMASLTCCTAGTPVPEPVDPACFTVEVGATAGCFDAAYLKSMAVEACASKGWSVTGMAVDAPCADGSGFARAKYTCCSTGTTDPNPPTDPCAKVCDAAGNCKEPCAQPPTGCVDVKALVGPNAPGPDPKTALWEQCRAMGLELTGMTPGDVLDPATGTQAWYGTCCGTPVVPPTDPTACTEVPVKFDPATSDPKTAAYEQCKAMGLDLQDLRPGEPDASGQIWLWYASCCRPSTPVDPPAQTCTDIKLVWDPSVPGTDPKTMAWEQCKAMGLELQDLKQGDWIDPATGAAVWYGTCCGTPVVPPTDPTACTEVPVKFDPAASDPKTAAYEQCKAMGLDLRDLRPGEPDASGQVWLWYASCCGTPVVPPTDPGACTRIEVKAGPNSPDPKMAAYEQCKAMGLELTDLQPGFIDDAGQVWTWVAGCCGPSTPVDPPAQTCTDIKLVWDPSVPGTDPKMMAWEQCKAMGLELQDLKQGEWIDPATGASIWYGTCCGTPVVPPTDPGACTRLEVKADPNSPDPKMAAYEQCKAMGLELTDLQPGAVDAAGQAWTWIATCCGPSTPVEPPAQTCTRQPLGDGKTCVAPDLWKTHATQACALQNLVLGALEPAAFCADGTWSLVTIACCG